MEAEDNTNRALEEVKRLKKFFQKGYDKKSWEERKPDVIKNLISAEKNLTSALLDLEEIYYDKGETE